MTFLSAQGAVGKVSAKNNAAPRSPKHAQRRMPQVMTKGCPAFGFFRTEPRPKKRSPRYKEQYTPEKLKKSKESTLSPVVLALNHAKTCLQQQSSAWHVRWHEEVLPRKLSDLQWFRLIPKQYFFAYKDKANSQIQQRDPISAKVRTNTAAVVRA